MNQIKEVKLKKELKSLLLVILAKDAINEADKIKIAELLELNITKEYARFFDENGKLNIPISYWAENQI